jgi:hypothetical protein
MRYNYGLLVELSIATAARAQAAAQGTGRARRRGLGNASVTGPVFRSRSTSACAQRCQGTVERIFYRGDRATEPIEDIWLEQIRGCSCRERMRVRYPPIAAKFRSTAK